MQVIKISVRERIAATVGKPVYICGNSSYIVHFDFDAEWDAMQYKTARFIAEDGRYFEKIFTGNDCPVPIINNTRVLRVGVYAGNLQTTTPAIVQAAKSILCGGGVHSEPPADVYMQIMEKLNMISDDIGAAVLDYLEKHPIEGGVDFETDETLTLADGVLSVNTAEGVEKDNTLPVTAAAVYAEVGNINALLETI